MTDFPRQSPGLHAKVRGRRILVLSSNSRGNCSTTSPMRTPRPRPQRNIGPHNRLPRTTGTKQRGIKSISALPGCAWDSSIAAPFQKAIIPEAENCDKGEHSCVHSGDPLDVKRDPLQAEEEGAETEIEEEEESSPVAHCRPKERQFGESRAFLHVFHDCRVHPMCPEHEA
eukprot:CAMPEP_0206584608 /NCGR_PEP_ID=MMETSP0325_2-20121206/35845_1 /ASSEMBLY_ACC=CAM_ASM_000347 /TAXON_ID=2866 /ORGANISM="Crypthecodinium cohnii, Strain Seligo" /LENGTH=170 /DNA_ID=CAMNT_0054091841 /DNA_START=390 /DNA_END=903 /DNA_ORIENTATION=-